MSNSDTASESNNMLGPPSVSYRQARESGVYRLSELMFGSLLAAYILGFVGASSTINRSAPDLHAIGNLLFVGWQLIANALANASGVQQFSTSSSHPFFHAIDYLLISLCFSYLTASLYIAYHVGILSMPHVAMNRLRWDFFVALSQAVAYGISLLTPAIFLLLTSIVLLLSLLRQRFEAQRLVDHIDDYLQRQTTTPQATSPNRDDIAKERRDSISKTIRKAVREKDISALRTWDKPTLVYWSGAALLALLGVLAVIRPTAQWLHLSGLDGVIQLITILMIIYISHRMLGSRGKLLVPASNHANSGIPDSAADKLTARLLADSLPTSQTKET